MLCFFILGKQPSVGKLQVRRKYAFEKPLVCPGANDVQLKTNKNEEIKSRPFPAFHTPTLCTKPKIRAS